MGCVSNKITTKSVGVVNRKGQTPAEARAIVLLRLRNVVLQSIWPRKRNDEAREGEKKGRKLCNRFHSSCSPHRCSDDCTFVQRTSLQTPRARAKKNTRVICKGAAFLSEAENVRGEEDGPRRCPSPLLPHFLSELGVAFLHGPPARRIPRRTLD